MSIKYSQQIFWSEEDEGFIARCPELSDVSAFGTTPSEAAAELEIAVSLAVESIHESGEAAPTPIPQGEFSGQFRLRLPSSLHESLARRAEAEGVSQNLLAVTLIAESLGVARANSRAARELRAALQATHETMRELGVAASSHDANNTYSNYLPSFSSALTPAHGVPIFGESVRIRNSGKA